MSTARLHILFFVFLLFAVVIVGRLFTLQVHDYGMFAALARGQQQVYADVDPERGRIFAGGAPGEDVLFAGTRDMPVVYAVPRDIENQEEVLALLVDVLNLSEEEIEKLARRLERDDDPFEPIAERLKDEQGQLLLEADLKGLHVTSQRVRYYPQNSRLAHILGFIGFDAYGNRRGVYGLEAAYEKLLYGVPGKLRGERDGQGRILETLDSDAASAASPGADIVLTIDPNIQYQVEKFLGESAEKYLATGGTVVVLEAKTGAVRALANFPTFDPNTYSDVEDIAVYTNAAISSQYEPGSIFKPITMAAGLDTGAVYPEMTYLNTGSVKISGYTISNTLRQFDGEEMTMIEVLRNSLNTGAMFVEEQTGHEAFEDYVKAFGFGSATDIELPGEVTGSIANLATGRDINYATASFGQGISATPIQMVSAIGAIANGGTLMRPYIIDEIRYPDGSVEKTEQESVRDVIAPRTSSRLSAMLTRVVDDGSGYMAQIPGYSIAGKTGTAQIANTGSAGYESEYIHSFVGYFPAFDPEYVILIKIDRPQGARYASVSAAPVFREIAEYLITYAAIPPDRPTDN